MKLQHVTPIRGRPPHLLAPIALANKGAMDYIPLYRPLVANSP